MEVSIVVPIYNERDNLAPLYHELKDVLDDMNKNYEIIFVDDGSTDGSFEEMVRLFEEEDHLRIVKLRSNFGQSSALQAGFDISNGEIIVAMDADLQNDPKDIPRLLEKLKEGYDCVSGWRMERKDPLGKRIMTKISSLVRRRFLGTDLHDYGCTLKAYRREALAEIEISGEMHRYIPPMLKWRGFDVTEIEVNHRERTRGETKYGTTRVFKGFMDMINVWFWQKFHGRPLHLFGGLGLISAFIGLIAALISFYWKFFGGVSFTSTPLPLFSVFMFLTGLLLFSSGLLADVLLKNYYSLEERRVYSVEKVVE